MRLVTVILCAAAYAASFFWDTNFLGFSEGAGGWHRVSYMFAHTGWLHTAINVFSFTVMDGAMERVGAGRLRAVAWVSAVAATFGTECALPTVGLSGVVYGMLGVVFGRVHDVRMCRAMAGVALSNVAVFFWGHSNVPLHGLSFLYSFIVTLAYDRIRGYVRHKSGCGGGEAGAAPQA